MQRQHRAVIGQIIALGPVAGLDRVRCAAQRVHRHGQGVYIVLKVKAVGEGVVQRLLQRGKAVGVVPGVQRIERDLHQQGINLMTGVEYIVRQIKRLLERGTAEREVLPRLPGQAVDQLHIKMSKAAVA